VNTSHSSGADGFDGPSTAAHIGTPRGVTVTSNGTIYVSDSTRVYEISPAGFLRVVAGTGAGTFNGDFGTATSVALSNRRRPRRRRGDRHAVHRRHLERPHPRRRHRERQPVPGRGRRRQRRTRVRRRRPRHGRVPVHPAEPVYNPADGYLYIADQGHNRVRPLDVTSGVIEAFLDPTGCTGAVAFQSCSNTKCGLAIDSQGLYVAGCCAAPARRAPRSAWSGATTTAA
jgi:DNA-binding beta-propeller fold protein YncE